MSSSRVSNFSPQTWFGKPLMAVLVTVAGCASCDVVDGIPSDDDEVDALLLSKLLLEV